MSTEHSIELSNLRPAEGSTKSDNFRRGRGHGSGNGKTAGKGHKGQKLVPEHRDPVLKVVRCLYTEDCRREVSHVETPSTLLALISLHLRDSRMVLRYQ